MQDLEIFYEVTIPHLVMSAPLILGMWFATWRGRRAIAITAILLLIFVPLHPFVYGVTLAGLTAMAAVWRLAGLRKWTYFPAAVVMATLPFIAIVPPYVRRYHEMEAIRDLYPPTSIADRLAYEPRSRPKAAAETTGPTASGRADDSHAASIAAELERFDKKLRRFAWDQGADARSRALWGLDALHDQIVHEFTEEEGFGRQRAIWPDIQLRTIELPDLAPLPVVADSAPATSEPSAANDEIARGDAGPAPEALRDLHEASAIDFVNPRGFGSIDSRERVRGFQSHGFRSRPEVPLDEGHASSWRIVRLELVSLLKHATPIAYVSENLPRMQELAEAPTRELDRFESEALERLRSGEGLVAERETEELRLLGPLRAGSECSKCHRVNRGDLLGAFTYRLRRDLPERANVAKPTL